MWWWACWCKIKRRWSFNVLIPLVHLSHGVSVSVIPHGPWSSSLLLWPCCNFSNFTSSVITRQEGSSGVPCWLCNINENITTLLHHKEFLGHPINYVKICCQNNYIEMPSEIKKTYLINVSISGTQTALIVCSSLVCLNNTYCITILSSFFYTTFLLTVYTVCSLF